MNPIDKFDNENDYLVISVHNHFKVIFIRYATKRLDGVLLYYTFGTCVLPSGNYYVYVDTYTVTPGILQNTLFYTIYTITCCLSSNKQTGSKYTMITLINTYS